MPTRARLVWSCLLLAVTCATPRTGFAPVRYPPTRVVDQVDDYHGTSVSDPYRWLEDDRSAETEAWVRSQNELTDSVLRSLPARRSLSERLKELWNYERRGPPVRHGELWSWSANDGLQDHSVTYLGSVPGGPGRVLFDPNRWSDDGTVSLAGTSFSDDGKLVAWALSEGGSDWRTWKVRDTRTGKNLPDEIHWVKFNQPAWLPDGSGFYYSRYPEPRSGDELKGVNRDMKAYFHPLGGALADDVLVHEDPEHADHGFSAFPSEDGQWLLLHTWRGAASKNLLHARPLDESSAPFRVLDDSWDTDATYVGNDGGIFYLQTTSEAVRGRVVAVDIQRPGRNHWLDVVPETADTLRSVGLFGDTFVVRYMRDAHDVLVLHPLDDGDPREVDLPGMGSIAGLEGRREQRQTWFSFTSFTRPSSVYRLDVARGRAELHWSPRLRFDPDRFTTRQVQVTSRDGAQVPMFLVCRKDLEPDGDHPAFLHGYGGFNVSLSPRFSVGRIPFLERGGVYAQPSLRGGGEYGEDWHEAGKLGKKQNVFDDFIAAAEWLVDSGWARPDGVAISGGSNGGLLVGAVLTQRPDLFACAVPRVGVMDMLRYHRFTIGWAWAGEYGSSDDPEQFEFLRAYSPLHNLAPGTTYPPTLLLTGDHDDRVVPAHSFKFGAAMQAAQGGPAPVLLRIETRAGHGAGKPLDMRIAEAADVWAFVLQALGET